VRLSLAIKESKNTLAKKKFEYEVQIPKLQIRLQLATPLEVQEERKKELKAELKGISDTVAKCRNLLDDTM